MELLVPTGKSWSSIPEEVKGEAIKRALKFSGRPEEEYRDVIRRKLQDNLKNRLKKHTVRKGKGKHW